MSMGMDMHIAHEDAPAVPYFSYTGFAEMVQLALRTAEKLDAEALGPSHLADDLEVLSFSDTLTHVECEQVAQSFPRVIDAWVIDRRYVEHARQLVVCLRFCADHRIGMDLC